MCVPLAASETRNKVWYLISASIICNLENSSSCYRKGVAVNGGGGVCKWWSAAADVWVNSVVGQDDGELI